VNLKSSIKNFMNTHSVGAGFIYTDRWRNMMKLIGAFHDLKAGQQVGLLCTFTQELNFVSSVPTKM